MNAIHPKTRAGRGVRAGAVLMLAATLALTGCRAAETETTPAEEGALATTAGFDGETFTVGVITATSGAAAANTAPALAGLQSYFEALNAEGGIDGKYPVEIVVRDNAMDAAKTVQQYESVKNDVAMFSQVFATPQTKAVLPNITRDGVVAIAQGPSGELLREPNMIITAGPYETWLITGAQVAMEQFGDDAVVCGLAGEGDTLTYMENALDAAEADLGTNVGVVVAVATGAGDYAPQIQQLKSAGCDAVLYLALAVPVMSTAWQAAAQVDFAPKWIGTPSGWDTSLKTSPLMPYLEKNVEIICDCVEYGDTDAPGMAALMAAHEKYAPEVGPNWIYRSGYLQGKATADILSAAVESGDVSREGILAAAGSLTSFDFEGLQFPSTWGAQEDRRPAELYSVFAPDATAEPNGLALVEAGRAAPDAAVDFAYEVEASQ